MAGGGADGVPWQQREIAQRMRSAGAAPQADRDGADTGAGWNVGCFLPGGTPVAPCGAMKRFTVGLLLTAGPVIAAGATGTAWRTARPAAPEPSEAAAAGDTGSDERAGAGAASRALPWLHNFAATAVSAEA